MGISRDISESTFTNVCDVHCILALKPLSENCSFNLKCSCLYECEASHSKPLILNRVKVKSSIGDVTCTACISKSTLYLCVVE